MRDSQLIWLYPALVLQEGTTHDIPRDSYDSVTSPISLITPPQKHHIILCIRREMLLIFSSVLNLYQPCTQFHCEGK